MRDYTSVIITAGVMASYILGLFIGLGIGFMWGMILT